VIARLLIAILLSGCAQNGILELLIDLPPAPADTGPDPWFATVQVRRESASSFMMPWDGEDPVAVELGPEPVRDCISVVADEDDFNLEIRVRFCRDQNCLSFADGTPPERLYRLEHPIYIGRRTYWREQILSVPNCMEDEDCEVGRCIEGRCGCVTTADCCGEDGCLCPRPPCYSCEDGGDTDTGIDTCVESLTRCHIEGCTSGDPSMWCTMGGTEHFCEQSNWAPRTNTYMCGG
jgi:hypothetical protein